MLGLVPYNNEVQITHISPELDSWGLAGKSETVTYNCYLRDVAAVEYTSYGKDFTATYTLGIAGDVPVKLIDKVITAEGEFDIVKIRKIRDLSGETITTLVYV